MINTWIYSQKNTYMWLTHRCAHCVTLWHTVKGDINQHNHSYSKLYFKKKLSPDHNILNFFFVILVIIHGVQTVLGHMTLICILQAEVQVRCLNLNTIKRELFDLEVEESISQYLSLFVCAYSFLIDQKYSTELISSRSSKKYWITYHLLTYIFNSHIILACVRYVPYGKM